MRTKYYKDLSIFHVNKLVSNIKQASEILKKFEEIRQRGRKRTMLG